MRDRRALGMLDDSKQRSAEEREELYPIVIRAAASVAVTIRCVRGIDSRGLHVTNLARARPQPRAGRGAGRGLPHRRLSASPTARSSTAR